MKLTPLLLLSLVFVTTPSFVVAQNTPQYDLLVEDFNGAQFPPSGWESIDTMGNGEWENDRSWGQGSAMVPGCKYRETLLFTPGIDISAQDSFVLLSFNGEKETGCLRSLVYISVYLDGSYVADVGQVTGDNQTIDLTNYVLGGSNLELSFNYINAHISGGDTVRIDNVKVIGGNDPGSGGGGGTDPVADFSFSPQEGDAPLHVQFIDQSTGGPIASYSWSFGDGSTSTQTNPAHIYTSQGTYFPSLTVVSTNGASSTSTSSSPVTVHNSNNGGGTSGGGGGDWDTENEGDGDYDGGKLGAAITNIHDVNGDGICDFAVGSPGVADVASGIIYGAVMIHAGGTGTQIREIWGQNADSGFGSSVAGVVGINASGSKGLLIGAPLDASGVGRAYLYNAETGALVHTLQPSDSTGIETFGASVKVGPDANGDGIADLLVGAPNSDTNGSTDNGALFCFDTVTGSEIYQSDGPPSGILAGAGPGLGTTSVTIHDVDGDGTDDILVGIPWADPMTASGVVIDAGIAQVKSGANGSTIWTLKDLNPQPSDFYGMAVRAYNDVDADGVPDFVIGVAGANINTLAGGVLNNAGKIVVCSGATGSVITEVPGPNADGESGSNITVGDVNGDGVSDVASSMKEGGSGFAEGQYNRVAVFDVISGQVIQTMYGDPGDDFGAAVAFVCDQNGDGRDDFVVGFPGADSAGNSDNGGFVTHGYDPYASTTDPIVDAGSGFSVTWDFDFPVENATQVYRILSSLGGIGPIDIYGVSIPLTPDDMFWASLFGHFPIPDSRLTGRLDANGDLTLTFSAGPGGASSWVGMTIYSSCLVFNSQRLPVDASGFVTLSIY
jgi:PKD repeat protein